jgi:hypothetical protein
MLSELEDARMSEETDKVCDDGRKHWQFARELVGGMGGGGLRVEHRLSPSPLVILQAQDDVHSSVVSKTLSIHHFTSSEI